jgi:hypothetical protein
VFFCLRTIRLNNTSSLLLGVLFAVDFFVVSDKGSILVAGDTLLWDKSCDSSFGGSLEVVFPRLVELYYSKIPDISSSELLDNRSSFSAVLLASGTSICNWVFSSFVVIASMFFFGRPFGFRLVTIFGILWLLGIPRIYRSTISFFVSLSTLITLRRIIYPCSGE